MRNETVMARVQEHYDELKSRGYNIAFLALQGSQNYGLDVYLNTYTSDVDTKAVVLPTLEDIASGSSPVSTTIVLENNEHIDVKDIRMMRDMFLKQNISYLEVLFSDYVIVNPVYENLVRELFEVADLVAQYNHITFYKSIKGMVFEKMKALCHPYPTTMAKIEKFGYDPKQLHHIERLNEMVHRLKLGTSFREVLKSANAPYLLSLKLGSLSLEQAQHLADISSANTAEECDALAAQDKPIGNEIKEFLNYLTTELIKASVRLEL